MSATSVTASLVYDICSQSDGQPSYPLTIRDMQSCTLESRKFNGTGPENIYASMANLDDHTGEYSFKNIAHVAIVGVFSTYDPDSGNYENRDVQTPVSLKDFTSEAASRRIVVADRQRIRKAFTFLNKGNNPNPNDLAVFDQLELDGKIREIVPLIQKVVPKGNGFAELRDFIKKFWNSEFRRENISNKYINFEEVKKIVQNGDAARNRENRQILRSFIEDNFAVRLGLGFVIIDRDSQHRLTCFSTLCRGKVIAQQKGSLVSQVNKFFKDPLKRFAEMGVPLKLHCPKELDPVNIKRLKEIGTKVAEDNSHSAQVDALNALHSVLPHDSKPPLLVKEGGLNLSSDITDNQYSEFIRQVLNIVSRLAKKKKGTEPDASAENDNKPSDNAKNDHNEEDESPAVGTPSRKSPEECEVRSSHALNVARLLKLPTKNGSPYWDSTFTEKNEQWLRPKEGEKPREYDYPIRFSRPYFPLCNRFQISHRDTFGYEKNFTSNFSYPEAALVLVIFCGCLDNEMRELVFKFLSKNWNASAGVDRPTSTEQALEALLLFVFAFGQLYELAIDRLREEKRTRLSVMQRLCLCKAVCKDVLNWIMNHGTMNPSCDTESTQAINRFREFDQQCQNAEEAAANSGDNDDNNDNGDDHDDDNGDESVMTIMPILKKFTSSTQQKSKLAKEQDLSDLSILTMIHMHHILYHDRDVTIEEDQIDASSVSLLLRDPQSLSGFLQNFCMPPKVVQSTYNNLDGTSQTQKIKQLKKHYSFLSPKKKRKSPNTSSSAEEPPAKKPKKSNKSKTKNGTAKSTVGQNNPTSSTKTHEGSTTSPSQGEEEESVQNGVNENETATAASKPKSISSKPKSSEPESSEPESSKPKSSEPKSSEHEDSANEADSKQRPNTEDDAASSSSSGESIDEDDSLSLPIAETFHTLTSEAPGILDELSKSAGSCLKNEVDSDRKESLRKVKEMAEDCKRSLDKLAQFSHVGIICSSGNCPEFCVKNSAFCESHYDSMLTKNCRVQNFSEALTMQLEEGTSGPCSYECQSPGETFMPCSKCSSAYVCTNCSKTNGCLCYTCNNNDLRCDHGCDVSSAPHVPCMNCKRLCHINYCSKSISEFFRNKGEPEDLTDYGQQNLKVIFPGTMQLCKKCFGDKWLWG